MDIKDVQQSCNRNENLKIYTFCKERHKILYVLVNSMINRDICKFVYVFDKLSFLEKNQIGLD